MEIPDDQLFLFVAFLGGKPYFATIEQHNVFFGVGPNLEFLYPAMRSFWPQAGKGLHIDAWMRVDHIGKRQISVSKLTEGKDPRSVVNPQSLFFVNLGGYRSGVFGEDHKPLLIIARNMHEALEQAKRDAFFTSGHAEGAAVPHIDDKLQIDGFADHDGALDISALMKQNGYVLTFDEDGATRDPEVNITGFLRISE